MPRGEKKWSELLLRQLSDEEKDKIKQAGNMPKYNQTLYISNIIGGDRLNIRSITCYLNYVGNRDKRKVTFLAVTLEEFENEKDKLSRRWEKLSGVAVVKCINNTTFQSVYFSPGKADMPIIGYDSKKMYGASSRFDLSGEKCSRIGDWNSWTTKVFDEREKESLNLLVTFISRVARTVGEIKRMSMSDSMLAKRGTRDRGWKIIRTFVSQEDDKSSGVLTCLFLECMKRKINVSGVEKEISPQLLEEYRWGIANKCYKYMKEDYVEKGRCASDSGNIIEIIH